MKRFGFSRKNSTSSHQMLNSSGQFHSVNSDVFYDCDDNKKNNEKATLEDIDL